MPRPPRKELITVTCGHSECNQSFSAPAGAAGVAYCTATHARATVTAPTPRPNSRRGR